MKKSYPLIWISFILLFNIPAIAQTPWFLPGNATTNPAFDFLGTTDNVDVSFRTFNANRMRLKNTHNNPILKWETEIWGEIPADFGRK